MEKMMAQRFAFCEFSEIVGFPNALPDRDQWEDSLPEFHATSWEEPAEHLLDFHEAIHRHNITHEDVRIKLFRCSLKGVALEWCQSLPAASIRSLTGFYTAFNSFCKDYYPADCLFKNCCEEFLGYRVEADVPSSSAHDDEDPFFLKEGLVMEEVSSLFPRGFLTIYFYLGLKRKGLCMSSQKQQVPLSLKRKFFTRSLFWRKVISMKDNPFLMYIIVMMSKQAYPTFDHYKDTKDPVSKQNHPMVPIYDEYESNPRESQEEEKEPEEQLSTYFIREPVSKQLPPEISEPTSVVHSPVLIKDIQPHVSNSVEKEATCHQFSEIHHSFYDPVSEYMEWHVLYSLEPPYSISTSPCEKKLKSVVVLLSKLHHLLVIINRKKELPFRKLLDWIWWKSSFT
jgi:hypothetical protein